jgi:hypothetical protein
VNPHWELFHRFATAELESGGPDPQVLLTARAVQGMEWRRAQVAAGWFVAPYTCGAAAALWANDLWDLDEERLRQWLAVHHEGLPTRRERRAIWGAEQRKLARCLTSWRDWAHERLRFPWSGTYDDLYRSIESEVDYFGRYATMKVIEVLYQAGLVGTPQSDVRARGAKYPRKSLALLWPEHEVALNVRGDPATTVQLAERLALEVQQALGGVSLFQVETLLCNYRQSLDGKYPGRSHDRELAHWVRAERYWGEHLREALPFFDLRWQLFPHDRLGERGTPPWWGAREALEVAAKAQVKEALACTSA